MSFPFSRIVIGGFRAGNGPRSSPFLVAYDQNGNLDRSFGKNGVVDPGLRSGGYRIHGIAAGGGGRIVTVGNLRETPGSGTPALVLRRYKASGKVDKSFGRNGSVVLKAQRRQSYSSFDDVAVLKSGKIVAVGHKTGRLFAVRTNSRGRLDRSFSNDGKFSLRKNRNAGCDTPGCRVKASLATLPDGGLIIQGESLQSYAPILKLNKRGVLNRNFGTNGHVGIPFSEVGYPSEVATTASGGIVLASNGVDSPGPKQRTAFKVTQLRADGSRDTAFGTDGVLTLEPSASGGAATSAFPMRGGAALVGGATTQPNGAPSLYRTRLVKIAAR